MTLRKQPPPPEGAFETLLCHYGEARLAAGGSAAPPIAQASTFVYPNAESFERRLEPGNPYYDYTRVGNPTTELFEWKLAALERGAWARAFASGMGAISAVINANVRAGAHVVAVASCYGPTRSYLEGYLDRFGVGVTFVNSVRTEDFVTAIRPETRLLYLESPTSGVYDMLEIPALTAVARSRGIVTAFDNSYASPFYCSPLDLGVDLVLHSATKYIGGHSDVVAGVVVGRAPELERAVRREAELVGATLDPFAAWLLLRGLRTLAVRMERHQQTGLRVARFLAEHPRVRRVRHPGLADHPGHDIARRQLRGYAGIFSFELHDQSRAATHAVIDRLRWFSIGVSWGGHESLVVGGKLFSLDPANPLWLIRLHCGLENADDLIADLAAALDAK